MCAYKHPHKRYRMLYDVERSYANIALYLSVNIFSELPASTPYLIFNENAS